MEEEEIEGESVVVWIAVESRLHQISGWPPSFYNNSITIIPFLPIYITSFDLISSNLDYFSAIISNI